MLKKIATFQKKIKNQISNLSQIKCSIDPSRQENASLNSVGFDGVITKKNGDNNYTFFIDFAKLNFFSSMTFFYVQKLILIRF